MLKTVLENNENFRGFRHLCAWKILSEVNK